MMVMVRTAWNRTTTSTKEVKKLTAFEAADIRALGVTGYLGARLSVTVPQRRRRKDPKTGKYRPLSAAQKEVNTAHARLRGPGERANAQLNSWKIRRKIRSSPNQATRPMHCAEQPHWRKSMGRRTGL
jgi:hypothetical protein